jgi:hypothetical protein
MQDVEEGDLQLQVPVGGLEDPVGANGSPRAAMRRRRLLGKKASDHRHIEVHAEHESVTIPHADATEQPDLVLTRTSGRAASCTWYWTTTAPTSTPESGRGWCATPESTCTSPRPRRAGCIWSRSSWDSHSQGDPPGHLRQRRPPCPGDPDLHRRLERTLPAVPMDQGTRAGPRQGHALNHFANTTPATSSHHPQVELVPAAGPIRQVLSAGRLAKPPRQAPPPNRARHPPESRARPYLPTITDQARPHAAEALYGVRPVG